MGLKTQWDWRCSGLGVGLESSGTKDTVGLVVQWSGSGTRDAVVQEWD